MAGASLDIQLTISNAAEVKAAFESLQARLADLTPVFQDIGESMLNRTRKRFEDSVAPDGTPPRGMGLTTC
jgi:cobalamin biosynthesis protein CbiD